MLSANELLEMADRYLLQTYSRPPLVLDHGQGMELVDTEGRRYLDFISGIAVNALGYADATTLAAISEQAPKLLHVSNLFYTAPAIELAKALADSCFADRVFFTNSGTEAVEGALKFARKVARDRFGEGKTAVLAFEGSFHGRTMGSLAVTHREKYRKPFAPLMPGARFAPFNDIAALEEAMGDDLCAVIIEPVQGEGGLRSADQAFLQRLRELCDRHNVLLIADEIQCGFARTGDLWAHTASGISPDMMVVAKPLGGGLPIGAILLTEAIANHIHVGDHGTTFAGGPLVCAVALAVFRKLSGAAMLEHVRTMGAALAEGLEDLQAELPEQVLEVRGRGLMRGVRIAGSAAGIVGSARERGLLIGTSGEDILRLLPPLIVEQEDTTSALHIIRDCLETQAR